MARVEWLNNVENRRSSAAAQRLGFTLEGIKRQSFVVYEGGPSQDTELWALLADEWKRSATTADGPAGAV